MGESDVRGFDIRGPRPARGAPLLRAGRPTATTCPGPDGNGVLLPIDDDSTQDDALGGTAMYVMRAEVEIPMGSGVRELGIRPSVFFDVGSVFGISDPILTCSPYPERHLHSDARRERATRCTPRSTRPTPVDTVCTPTSSSVAPTRSIPIRRVPDQPLNTRAAARCRRSSRSSTATPGSRASRSASASTGSLRSARSGSTSPIPRSYEATTPRSSRST
jgi:hypothetical protein